jgi:hypothetical protein
MSNPDPLGGDRRPSISFKSAPVGTTYKGRVVEAPQQIQARNFDTGKPKMTVVIGLEVDGVERSLWAPVPSAMLSALRDAQKAAGEGARIEVGGELAVRLTGEEPIPGKPHLNPKKVYAAKYTPPVASATPDPFEDTSAPAAGVTVPAAAAPVDTREALQAEPW